MFIAVVATFFSVMRHEFGGWDDEQNLTLNPQMHPPTWSAVRGYWLRPKYDLYAPVTWTLWSLLAQVGYQPSAPTPEAQLNPYLFHTMNLALHVGSALLAFEFMRRVFGADRIVPATIGALLFALHPVQVEPVAWVSGLKDVLAGMLAIGAIVLFLDSSRDWKRYVAAMFIFALAMLSKPSAVVVPAIVIAIDVLVRHSRLKHSLLRCSPAIALAIVGAIIARLAQQASHVPSVAWWKRPLIALDTIAFYFGKIIWPLHLGVDYGRTPQRVLAFEQFEPFWFWPIIVGLLIVILFRAMRDRVLIAAPLVSLLAIAPVLGLLTFDFQEYSTVADHYLYLAMLGPAMFVASLAHLARRFTVIAIAILVACAGLSVRPSLTWHDARSISEQAIRANPKSKLWGGRLTKLEIDAANALADQGDTSGAMDLYSKVLARDPENVIAISNIAALRERAKSRLPARSAPN